LSYTIALGPLKIYILLKTLDSNESIEAIGLNLHFCFYFNISVGIIMFLIRSSETNFYQLISRSCCRRKNQNDGNSGKYFVDVPLTSIISRNMNLEFMCCILYGLSDIFNKTEKKSKNSVCEDFTCTLNYIEIDKSKNLSSNLLLSDKSNSKEKSLMSSNISK
jgi:hypothetical protein